MKQPPTPPPFFQRHFGATWAAGFLLFYALDDSPDPSTNWGGQLLAGLLLATALLLAENGWRTVQRVLRAPRD